MTNASPVNATATGCTLTSPASQGVVITVTGANWPNTESGSLAWSGGVGANTDTGTFSTNGSGVLTGTICFGAAEQTATSSTPITLTLTATDSVAPPNSASTSVTVNPYQTFATTCQIGQAPHSTCTINQLIQAPVVGTSLTISETTTGANQSQVTLSTVTLGIGSGDNQTQFANATGVLNHVLVQDDRGTLGGLDVTGQLASNFNNVGTQVGPSVDNVIPADFLTWTPAVALATPGSLPGDNAGSVGCPSNSSGSCVGPSGLPVGGNGTGSPVPSTSTPAEVSAGAQAVLNNSEPAGVAKELCGTNAAVGGGGGFVCSAGLSLAIPPYVAAGTYQATLNLVVIGY